jgi:hypothetical protein
MSLSCRSTQRQARSLRKYANAVNPWTSQTNSALETRRVPQVSLLRPGIPLVKANRVLLEGQKMSQSTRHFVKQGQLYGAQFPR